MHAHTITHLHVYTHMHSRTHVQACTHTCKLATDTHTSYTYKAPSSLKLAVLLRPPDNGGSLNTASSTIASLSTPATHHNM